MIPGSLRSQERWNTSAIHKWVNNFKTIVKDCSGALFKNFRFYFQFKQGKWYLLPSGPRTYIKRKEGLQKRSNTCWKFVANAAKIFNVRLTLTSSKHLKYVQFTSCVPWVPLECVTFFQNLTFKGSSIRSNWVKLTKS